tara:strand:- start:14 stop:508 length:495 start_codon:yes stop_codon:yes gene_type:complete
MELDNKWIENYEIEEVAYNNFYKDDVKYVKVYFLLINKNLILDNIHEENFLLEEKNILKKNQLISLINKYKENKNIKLISILKYNINLDSDNVIDYLNQDTNTNMFLKSIKSLDDISFDQTISMFEDLNSLFFVFVESNTEKKNQTKRIFLHSNHKKTKRNKKT